MKIGVAIPTRNAINSIETILDTVRDQTYTGEVGAYICDDFSTDGTTKFLRDRESWYAGYTRTNHQTGWPTATNQAVNMALMDGCDAVLLAASDDFLRLDCVEELVAAMPGNDFVIPVNQQVGDVGAKQVSQPDATLEMFCQPWGLHESPWCPFIDKALIRNYVWTEVGGYSTDITIPERPWGCAEDWEFWIKVFKAGFTKYTVVDKPLYYYVMHDKQLGRGRDKVHDLTLAALKAKHHDLPWKDQR